MSAVWEDTTHPVSPSARQSHPALPARIAFHLLLWAGLALAAWLGGAALHHHSPSAPIGSAMCLGLGATLLAAAVSAFSLLRADPTFLEVVLGGVELAVIITSLCYLAHTMLAQSRYAGAAPIPLAGAVFFNAGYIAICVSALRSVRSAQ